MKIRKLFASLAALLPLTILAAPPPPLIHNSITTNQPATMTNVVSGISRSAGASVFQRGSANLTNWSVLSTNVLGTGNANWATNVPSGGTVAGATVTNLATDIFNIRLGNAALTLNNLSDEVSVTGRLVSEGGFVGSGASISNINATNITGGNVAPARLGTNAATAGYALKTDGTKLYYAPDETADPGAGVDATTATNIAAYQALIATNDLNTTLRAYADTQRVNSTNLAVLATMGVVLNDFENPISGSGDFTTTANITGAVLQATSQVISATLTNTGNAAIHGSFLTVDDAGVNVQTTLNINGGPVGTAAYSNANAFRLAADVNSPWATNLPSGAGIASATVTSDINAWTLTWGSGTLVLDEPTELLTYSGNIASTAGFIGDGSMITNVGTVITTNQITGTGTSNYLSGTLAANKFYGDGSELTGIAAGSSEFVTQNPLTNTVYSTNSGLKIISVADFGAATNSADNTEAINLAIQAATNTVGGTDAEAGMVYIPPGIYYCSNTIQMYSDVTLMGAGPKSTTLWFKNPAISNGVECINYNTNNLTHFPTPAIRNLRISNGNYGPASGDGINFDSGVTNSNPAVIRIWSPSITDVKVTWVGRNGVQIQNCINLYMRNVYVTWATNGFYFPGSLNGATIQDCYAIANKAVGFVFATNSAGYTTMLNCAADENGVAGYAITNCTLVSMISCGAEYITNNGVILHGTISASLKDCFIANTYGAASNGITVVGTASGTRIEGGSFLKPVAGDKSGYAIYTTGNHYSSVLSIGRVTSAQINSYGEGTISNPDDWTFYQFGDEWRFNVDDVGETAKVTITNGTVTAASFVGSGAGAGYLSVLDADGSTSAITANGTNWTLTSGTVVATNFTGNGAWNTNQGAVTVPVSDRYPKYSDFSTNNNFAVDGVAGYNTYGTNVFLGTMVVTNTSGSTKTITLPASWLRKDGATCYLTNQGILSVLIYPGRGTNAAWHCNN